MAKILHAVLVLVFLCGISAQVEYNVVCQHTNETCYCPLEDGSGRTIEVCNFVLDIDLIHTFTRYELEKTSRDSRGTAGRVWYINETGQEQVHSQGGACSDDSADCTEAFYVDGYTFRSFVAINSRIPGPTIIVYEDQLVRAVVNNRLASEATSIHWHGMHQRSSNWMDGVDRVTQCGIVPGGSLTYVFRATPPGTHWYHSHTGAQRTDGMFGSLVVREKNIDPIKELLGSDFEDIPADHTISLLDWQFSNSIDLFTKIHASIRLFEDEDGNSYRGDELGQNLATRRTESLDGAETGPITYWSGLINGKGRHSTVNYTQTRLSIFTVSPNGTFRFRLVGAQNLYAFRVSVDEHKLRLIATDGVFVNYTAPVDFIVVHTGERYDFLLETKSAADVASKSNFMIRAETLEVLPNDTVNSAVAILHYDTSDIPGSAEYETIDTNSVEVASTCSADNMCTAINCPFQNYPSSYYINCVNIHQLRLLQPFDGDLPDADVGGASNQIFFNFGFEGSRQTSAINGRNLKLPASPLVQDRNAPDTCDLSEEISAECDQNVDAIISPNCFCTHIRELDGNVYIQMVLSAVGPEPEGRTNFAFSHPVHLHGHYFHVVDIQYGMYDESGTLISGRDEIDCGPNSNVLCTHPSWEDGQGADYSVGNSGKIDPLAPLKDTVIVPFGGYVVTYFKADNPGFWFLHCHIEAHQLEGMALILREGHESTHVSPPTGFPTCGNFSFSVDEYFAAIEGQAPLTDDELECYSSGWRVATIVLGIFLGIFFILSIVLGIFIAFLCIKRRRAAV